MESGFIFYFGPESEYSHWFACSFTIDGQRFCCVEQYLMYHKAMLFHDSEIGKRILRSADPRRHRYLGRQVAGFNKELWHQHCKRFAFDANDAKFAQNPVLAENLLQTIGKCFAEASPYDRLWGIGLSLKNPGIYHRAQWRGRNWAGEVLEAVRDRMSGDIALRNVQ